MAEPLLYLARCPHCGSVVAAATPRVVHLEPSMVTDWLQDGLDIERSESALCVEHHKPGCPFAGPQTATALA
jgi:hypothetical protein